GRFPGLVVDLYSQSTWQLVDSLLAGRLDFAVGFSPLPHPQLDFEEVGAGASHVVVRKDHPIFSNRRKAAFEQLRDYPATMHM
ncbi:LysR family transcriptional regulator substrate-binding protein, partial [Enterococcus faecium]